MAQNKAVENKTRHLLIAGAFREFCAAGYSGTNINRIVDKANITKGALYYYFKSKKELALAVVDDIVIARLESQWLGPLQKGGDPVDTLQGIILGGGAGRTRWSGQAKLWLEMMSMGGEFRQRLQGASNTLLSTITESLQRGRDNGQVRSDVDPGRVAQDIMTHLIGCRVLAEMLPDKSALHDCLNRLSDYTESLRAFRTEDPALAGAPADHPLR